MFLVIYFSVKLLWYIFFLKKRCLVRFLIGLWDVFLPLLMQYKWIFFLCTTYINICLSYSPTHSCQFTFFSWHSCVSILSKVLLCHAFINNGNLVKNGGVECEEICKHYGMNKIKTIFCTYQKPKEWFTTKCCIHFSDSFVLSERAYFSKIMPFSNFTKILQAGWLNVFLSE